ncbi:MAG: hypothetical protein KGM24_12715 [Elusimicrobia bacterium]|nr:hypothetical protein [Elusimicrobiota bacterium]
MTKRFLALLAAASLAASPAGAAAFYDVRPGARATGMGTAFSAIADDAFGMYYNPAGSANAPYTQAAGSLARFDSPRGTLTQAAAAYLRPYDPINTATVGASYSGERQRNGGDVDQMLFNYAQELKLPTIPLDQPLKVGANFKFVDASGTKDGKGAGKIGIGFDAGAIASSRDGFSMGAALTDLTNDVGLPRGGIVLGSAYTWHGWATAALDFRMKGGLAEFYPGVEGRFLNGLLKVRAGKGLSLDGLRTLAFGLGVDFSPVVLDVAMTLPPAGLNRPGGGFQATFQYRFGAPSFAGRFVGAAAAEAQRLGTEVNSLSDQQKTLAQETEAAATTKAAVEGELRALQFRTKQAQDRYRALLKRNAELEYQNSEMEAARGPAAKPLKLPKRRPRPKAPAWPKRHRVVAGDTLRALAGKYYGDPNLWEGIYRANPGKVDRGIPVEGAVLVIPAPRR